MMDIKDLARRCAASLGIQTTAARIRALARMVQARACLLYLRLRRGAPRAVRWVEHCVQTAGRRVVGGAAVAALGFAVGIAAIRVGWIARERSMYLWYPPHWDATSRLDTYAPGRTAPDGGHELSGIGGVSEAVYPLRIMTYTARPGDTLSGIARAFRLELDTVSSLNRVLGNGVHEVTVGERLRIPNQDGIFMTLRGSLDDMVKPHGLLAETVLIINELDNGLDTSAVVAGRELFFPWQHQGAELAIREGTAFIYPVAGRISSPYGRRPDPFDPTGPMRIHYGMDFAAPAGAPVRAARAGTVWLATQDPIFGNQILIGHESGMSTFYAHLDRVVVRVGQRVNNETVIGYVGSTGRVTGAHLHFEIRSNGVPRNPAGLLARMP